MPVVMIAALIIAAYIFSPPPIATGNRYVSASGDRWAGCGVPERPTEQDLRDCQEWQVEKRAMRRKEAEEAAP